MHAISTTLHFAFYSFWHLHFLLQQLVVLMAHNATRADSTRYCLPTMLCQQIYHLVVLMMCNCAGCCMHKLQTHFIFFFYVIIIFIKSSLLFFYVLRVIVSVAVAVAIHTAFPFMRHTKTRCAKK